MTESEFVRDAITFGELDQTSSFTRLAWAQNLWYLNQTQEFLKAKSDDKKKFSEPENYLAETRNRNSTLDQRFPQLKELATLLSISRLPRVRTAIVELTRKGNETRAQNLQAIKDAFHRYHEGKLDLPGTAGDFLLGIDYEKTEATVITDKRSNLDLWLGYPSAATQTSYALIREMYKNLSLSDKDVVYDLGSGYGRVLFYGAILNPKTKFKGIEIVPERNRAAQEAAKRFKLSNVEFVTADVLTQDFSDGTVFYIFNSFPSIMKTVFARLEGIAKKRKITIVVTGVTIDQMRLMNWAAEIRHSEGTDAIAFFKSKDAQNSEQK